MPLYLSHQSGVSFSISNVQDDIHMLALSPQVADVGIHAVSAVTMERVGADVEAEMLANMVLYLTGSNGYIAKCTHTYLPLMLDKFVDMAQGLWGYIASGDELFLWRGTGLVFAGACIGEVSTLGIRGSSVSSVSGPSSIKSVFRESSSDVVVAGVVVVAGEGGKGG